MPTTGASPIINVPCSAVRAQENANASSRPIGVLIGTFLLGTLQRLSRELEHAATRATRFTAVRVAGMTGNVGISRNSATPQKNRPAAVERTPVPPAMKQATVVLVELAKTSTNASANPLREKQNR